MLKDTFYYLVIYLVEEYIKLLVIILLVGVLDALMQLKDDFECGLGYIVKSIEL